MARIPKARIALFFAVLVALFAYAAIVDLGVNAGRIHYGVEIRRGLDVGGMTPSEADEVLKERAKLMLEDDILLGGRGVSVRFYPQQPEFAPDGVLVAGWAPRRGTTIDHAMAVGREGGPFSALADRWRAWWGGVKVKWQGSATNARVTEIIDTVEELGAEKGLTLDRWKLRLKIRRALNAWPRQPYYRIPFSDDA